VLPAKARKHSLFAQSSLSEIKPIQFIHLFEEAEKGDSLAHLLLEECLKAWGVCAVNIIHSYDPEIIIIAGAIMKRQNQILPYIQSMADKHAWLPPGTVKIVVAKQTEYASLLGMEYLVSQLNAMIN
jgi:glucokinase